MDVFVLDAILRLNSSQYDQELNNAKRSAGGIGNAIGTAFKVGAAAIAAATTAVTAFGNSAIKSGMQFDATMSEVAAISGAVGEDFDALRAKAQEMGATTKFSASESAEALTYMAMAGWKTEDMLSGLEGIMNLAAASGEDLATTSDIVTDALTAFGLTAADSGRFADILAAASSNANTNVSLMGETFKYVAPAAGALGYSAEDVATAIGLMANAGIKGSQAGTALRSVLTRLAKPTKESSKAMAALGLSLTDSSGNMKSFGDIMIDLREGFQNELVISVEEFDAALLDLNNALESGKLSQSEYDESLEELTERAYGAKGALMAQYAAMLGGQEAMSGLLAIVNASDEDFQKLTESVYGAEGAAKAMSATMQNNLLGDITILKSAIEGAKIALSDKLTPSLREFVKFGSNGISKLTEAFSEHGLNEAMATLGDILSEGISLIFDGIPGAFDAGEKLLDSLGKGISDNLDKLTGVAVKIISTIGEKIVISLPELAEAGMKILTGLLNGISESTKDNKTVQLVVNAVLGLAQSIVDNMPNLLDAGITFLTALVVGMADAIPDALPQITGMIIDLVDAISDPERTKEMISAAIALLTALADGLIGSVDVLITRSPEIVEQLVQSIVDNAPGMIEAGFALSGKLADGLTEPSTLEKLYDSGKAICKSIAKGVNSLIDSLFHIDIPQNMVGGLATSIILYADRLMPQSGNNIVNRIWDGIAKTIDKIKDGGIAIAQKVLEGIKTFDVVSWGQNVVTDFHNGISTWIKNVRDSGELMITKLWEGLKTFDPIEWGKEVVQDFVDGILKLLDDAFNAGEKIISKVREGINGLDPFTWGQDLISNLASGISSGWQSFGNSAVGGVAQNIKNLLGFSEPKEGPLSSFHEFAPDMMKLFAQGIKDNENIVLDQLEKSFDFGNIIAASGMPIVPAIPSANNRFGNDTTGNNRDIVINETIELDGAVLARKMYRYNINEVERHGAELVAFAR